MMIGSLLKEYRLKQNKSQRKFIGSIVTQSYYSKVEKNISQITADNLIGLLQSKKRWFIPPNKRIGKYDDWSLLH